eukprot:5158833-Amphidinium_carterae.2
MSLISRFFHTDTARCIQFLIVSLEQLLHTPSFLAQPGVETPTIDDAVQHIYKPIGRDSVQGLQ